VLVCALAMPEIPQPLGGALTALLIGLLLGLDRERAQRGHAVVFAGIRTFPLLALCGYLGALGAQYGFPLLLPVVLLGLVALGVASFALHPAEGATTEVAALLAALLGAVVAFGLPELAASLAVLATVLLTLRDPLHRLAFGISEDEVLAILKFAVVAVVVVPLLPSDPVGPYDAIVPREIGWLVVLLTAVSLAGYLLVRVLGDRAGYSLAGATGGLVSSTAVTLSFSAKARETPALAEALAVGVILASTVLYARGALVIAALDRPLGGWLAPRLVVLFVTGLLFAGWLYRRGRREAEKAKAVPLGNPVELGHAVLLAGLFAAVTLGARAAQAKLGTAGLWAVGLVGGLVDVDSVAVASARLRQQGSVEIPAAAATYLLATLSNLLFKGAAVAIAGGAALARLVLPAFVALALVTLVIVALR
jgi:uncharacterized membrane protein (DUF4010 family)